MQITTQYISNNPHFKYQKYMTVKGLMLHSVGCPQENPDVFFKTFNQSNYHAASVHGFIGADKVIVSAPIFEKSGQAMQLYHCGGFKGSATYTHIGIEMCEPSNIKYTGGATFTCSDKNKAIKFVEKTTANAVELFAKLCIFHHLDPLKDGVIISHYEGSQRGVATSHADPDHLWTQLGMNYNMDKFRTDVKAKMEEMEDDDMDVTKFAALMKEYNKTLEDNDAGQWSLEARNWAIQNKIISGSGTLPTGEVNYMWEKPLTRQEMVVLLYRFAQFMGKA